MVGFKVVLNLIFQELRKILIRMHCLLLSLTFTTQLECTTIFYLVFFCFSSLDDNESEAVCLSSLRSLQSWCLPAIQSPAEVSVPVPVSSNLHFFFVLASGFDKQVMKEFWFLYCPHAQELVLCIGVHGNVTLGFRT